MANFQYVENITTSQDLLQALQDAVTNFTTYPLNTTAGETAVTNAWHVVDSKTDSASGKVSDLTLGSTITIGTLTKDFHVRFVNLFFGDDTQHSSLSVQVLEGYDSTTGTYQNSGQPVIYEWADEAYTPESDRKETSPIYLYLNVTNNRLALVLVGDPAVNFNDYRKSFLYVGALKPFKYNQDDVNQNIMLTAGAVTAELTTPLPFGAYTSFGNNSMQMFQTKSGILFQKHYPSFITQAPQPGKAFVDSKLGDSGLALEPQGFNASAWTKKYHLSPIYVVHPYDGYRGQLDGCIAVSKNNILHLDELIVDVDDQPWKQEVYRYFDHNTEQNFMNYSANVKMGIAFLKEVRY